MDPWTTFLNLVSQVVTPVWGNLLQYLPLLMFGAVGLVSVGVGRSWQRNAAMNRPRVPQRITAGPMPPGVHLPGPSIWPFVLPIAGMFVLLALVLRPQGMAVNPVLLPIGLLIAAVAVLGWYRDAGREWRRTERGAQAEPSAPAVPLIGERQPPPGVHLPGPSPWPFFAPIALFFVFAGLVFGPLLLIGGLVMGFVAALGWYLDAGHEFRQVDAGHLAEPRTRDPARAFPIGIVKLYTAIAGVVIVITLAPWLFSFLPAGGASPSGGPAVGPSPTTAPVISTVSAISFEQKTVVVVAGQPLQLTFDNKQAGVPHNVDIFDSSAKTNDVFKGDIVTGPTSVVYNVPALKAGSYYFQCDVHPNMNGTLTAQ